MRDLSDRVGPPGSRDRFPFAEMSTVGDFFTVRNGDVRVMTSRTSTAAKLRPGYRFATHRVAGGARVFLVDVVDQQQQSAAA